MPYDEATGVVYKETVVGQHKCLNTSKHDTPRLRLEHGPAQGARSLLRMARNTLARNLRQLDASSLDGIPEVVVNRLWQWLKRSGADSVHAWQIFAGTGFFNKEFAKTYTIKCLHQECLPSVVMHADLTWLTDLTFGGFGESTRQAVVTLVPKIANLRVVHLHLDGPTQHDCLGDRDLRAWAFEAAERNALSKLETIVVEEQLGITISTLQYLDRFPSMVTFATRNCGIYARDVKSKRKIMETAQGLGWQTGDSSPMYRFILEQMPHHYWPQLVRDWVSQHSQNNLPILSVIAGQGGINPRVLQPSKIWCFERDWSHKPVESAQPETVIKKRRKVNSSAASQDMMSGIF